MGRDHAMCPRELAPLMLDHKQIEELKMWDEVAEQLEAKKVEIGAELASGRRQVDDVQAEVEAIDARLRELRGGGGRARWWRRGS